MATSEQLKKLIKAHFEHDDELFLTATLQIAAYEAKHGHDALARDIKALADKSTSSKTSIFKVVSQNSLLDTSFPTGRLSDLVVCDDIHDRIQRILDEFRNRGQLQKYGLANRRKILLEGMPGTGKTFTSAVIASELNLPLYTVQMDKLITKFMGETSAKLRQVFDSVQSTTGVYLFDEFDAIGADRSFDNEVGEMRRILNSFLQFIEHDFSESLIIAATNNQKLLDNALFRRFDDVLHYSMPTGEEVRRLLTMKLCVYSHNFTVTENLIKKALNLSHAEIIRASDDAIKHSVLNHKELTQDVVERMITERVSAYTAKEA